jgi:hypothetical protein
MNETIALTKASFVKLLDAMLYPNPDDPGDPRNPWGPYGPIGPVAQALRDLSWVLLNPQPLPPVAGPVPDPWRRLLWALLNPQPLPPVAGPVPDPWRSAFLARTVIDQAVAQYRSAEMLSAEQSERAFEAVRSYMREFVDDYCGTRPPRWPRPWPWPPQLDSVQLHPIDLLVAGAQFQKAADFDHPLRTDFSSAADQLFEAGLRRMENP